MHLVRRCCDAARIVEHQKNFQVAQLQAARPANVIDFPIHEQILMDFSVLFICHTYLSQGKFIETRARFDAQVTTLQRS
ncbi:MAG: hypothetical protein ACREMA_16015, partial [Longimicrobiales bacterium]